MLIVDADPIVARALSALLTGLGYAVDSAYSAEAGLTKLGERKHGTFAVVLVDAELPGLGGVGLLKRIGHGVGGGCVPVVLSAFGKLQSAVEAVRLGAADYLTKPIVETELVAAVERAAGRYVLMGSAKIDEAIDQQDRGDLLSEPVVTQLGALGAGVRSLWLMGEAGTGKREAARLWHESGPGARGECVEVDARGMDEAGLDEALKRARGGTLVLLEAEALAWSLQMDLWGLLQDSETVRVAWVTEGELWPAVASGGWVKELYYALEPVRVVLPALRSRRGELMGLAEAVLFERAESMGKVKRWGADALAAVVAYDWPGNLAELRSAVGYAASVSVGPTVGPGDLPEAVTGERKPEAMPLDPEGASMAYDHGLTLAQAMEGPERAILRSALEAHRWNRQATARALSIDRTTLYKKIKRYGLDRPA